MWEGTQQNFLGDENIIYLNCGHGYIDIEMVKTHQNVHLHQMHFSVGEFQLNHVDFFFLREWLDKTMNPRFHPGAWQKRHWQSKFNKQWS